MNYKQAPKLYHNAEKPTGNYYALPQNIMDVVFNELGGKNGNAIKLMVVLLGSAGDGSFRVSEKWIEQRSGMAKQNYHRTKKDLEEKGFLIIEDGIITVNVKGILRRVPGAECNSQKDLLTGKSEGHHHDADSNQHDDSDSNQHDDYNKEEIKKYIINNNENKHKVFCEDDIDVISLVLELYKKKTKYAAMQKAVLDEFSVDISYAQIKHIIGNKRTYMQTVEQKKTEMHQKEQEKKWKDFQYKKIPEVLAVLRKQGIETDPETVKIAFDRMQASTMSAKWSIDELDEAMFLSLIKEGMSFEDYISSVVVMKNSWLC